MGSIKEHHLEMAGLKFEGDLSQISDQQLKNIKSVIEKVGYTNGKVAIQSLGKAGDGYMADTKRVTIDNGKGGTLNMVAKVAPLNDHRRQLFQTTLLFRNEHIMYTKILPKFTQLEIAAGIPPQDRLRYAKCYGSSDDAPNEVILLEDLNDSNYKMLNRFEPLNDECVKLFLKNFARLHSLSYVLKHKEPVIWDEVKNDFHDVWASVSKLDNFQSFALHLETNTGNILESDARKKAVKGVANGFKDLTEMATYEVDAKHTVIQQGDSWTNNVMFTFDDEGVQDCCMIDYQLSKPASPVGDIMYMIFTCTNYEQRKEHFYDWLDYYHSELDNALSYHGLNAKLFYPKDQLEADLKRNGKAMFVLSIVLAGTLSMSVEEAAKLKQMMDYANRPGIMYLDFANITNPKSKVLLKKRIEEVLDSFLYFGLL